MEYYKKIDKSFLNGAMTIPNKYIDLFLQKQDIPLGTSRNIYLKFKGKEYQVRINNVKLTRGSSYYSLLWDNNNELMTELKKEFIQSYFAIESSKYNQKISGKHFITSLIGGNTEVIIFRAFDDIHFELETFIKITTPYDNMFKKLIDNNIFGWLSKPNKEYLYIKTTKWFNKTELNNHVDQIYVVYYLIDEIKKELYIGSATKLGNRVVIGRKEIPGWNKFKYDIIDPKYHHLLVRIEHHTIGAFASFMANNCKISSLNISDFKLVNKIVSKGSDKSKI
jgi:hypothetical protein